MAKGKESVRTAGPRRDTDKTPEGMRVVGRSVVKRGKKRAERLDGGANMEARDSDLRYVSRMVVVGELRSVKKKLRKIKDHHYSLIIGRS